MKIYGKIITDLKEWFDYHGTKAIPGCSYYALGLGKVGNRLHRTNGEEGGIAGCSGKANQLLGRPYYHPEDTMSWGFEGNGSDLTAAWLIAEALYYEEHGGTMGEGEHHVCEYTHSYAAVLWQMKRHYKQFSTEVIANLSDEWEMDTGWIKRWVMDREEECES